MVSTRNYRLSILEEYHVKIWSRAVTSVHCNYKSLNNTTECHCLSPLSKVDQVTAKIVVCASIQR